MPIAARQIGASSTDASSAESQDLRLVSSEIEVTPEGAVTWAQSAELELHAAAWPVFDIAASAIVHPFRYSDDDWSDLGATAVQQCADPYGRLRRWAQDFVGGDRTDTLSLLKKLSAGVSLWIGCQSRDDEGAQTLARGWTSCRDFAVLFVETARSLGFGARTISGYLFNPDERLAGTSGVGRPTPGRRSLYPGQAGSVSIR